MGSNRSTEDGDEQDRERIHITEKKKTLTGKLKKRLVRKKRKNKKEEGCHDGASETGATDEYITIMVTSHCSSPKQQDSTSAPQTVPATPRALTHAYRTFEAKSLETFTRIHMEAADFASEEDDKDTQFSATLRAANNLLSYSYNGNKAEGKPSKRPGQETRDAEPAGHGPLFSTFSATVRMETLWNLAVSNVCSNQILQQIGGREGNNLTDLTVVQLLDLVAWIEFFVNDYLDDNCCGGGARVGIGSSSDKLKAVDYDLCPDLSRDADREVDVDAIADNFAWVRNMLREVQRLAQSEYLFKTRDQTEKLLESVYSAERTPCALTDGTLSLSLSEDVFSFVTMQLDTSRQHLLTSNNDVMVMTVSIVFSELRKKQITYAKKFLHIDLERTCGAANDFHRMAIKTEEVFGDLCKHCQFASDVRSSLEEGVSELAALFVADGVHAAQSLHTFLFGAISESNIPERLFGREWECDYTYNEVAVSVVRTLEDYLSDLTTFLHHDILLRKLLHCLVSATVVFYVRCLLTKAEEHSSNSKGFFVNENRALTRILGDYDIFRKFFEGIVPEVPSLGKAIEREWHFLTVMHECLVTAQAKNRFEKDFDGTIAVLNANEVTDYIFVVHKLLGGNFVLTQNFLGDIWHLMNPKDERKISTLLESMKKQLDGMFDGHPEGSPGQGQTPLAVKERLESSPSLSIDSMLSHLYSRSKRKRPHHDRHTAVDKMVTSLKLDWVEDRGKKVREKHPYIDDDDENMKSKFDGFVQDLRKFDKKVKKTKQNIQLKLIEKGLPAVRSYAFSSKLLIKDSKSYKRG